MSPSPAIPLAFTVKKEAILASLSVPKTSYTDRSPKGSVDEAIKPLIDRLNALDGVVTTSSCAGRISVFLEGSKHGKRKGMTEIQEENESVNKGHQVIAPGGKGRGGRWLFVSHEEVQCPPKAGIPPLYRFGMNHGVRGFNGQSDMDINELRFARFQFEPMILHIMTASLRHAQPILAAAINAGFRESGIQSLKNLGDANAFPMIAVRSSGLALESIVGVVWDHVEDEAANKNNENKAENVDGDEISSDEDPNVGSLVSYDCLNLLVRLANERFRTNTERMKRFEEYLFSRQPTSGQEWEDSKTRHERKRAEGLEKQEDLRTNKSYLADASSPSSVDKDANDETLFGSLLTLS